MPAEKVLVLHDYLVTLTQQLRKKIKQLSLMPFRRNNIHLDFNEPLFLSFMSYFIYFPTSTTPQVQGNQNDESSMPSQKYYMAPTFPNTQYSLSQFPQTYVPYPPSYMINPIPNNGFSNPEINPVVEEQREPIRNKKIEREIESAKKNGQSNVINQFFSFFINKERSFKIVQRCISNLCRNDPEMTRKLIDIFYDIIHTVNQKRGRKYINRNIILLFFKPEAITSSVPDIEGKIKEFPSLRIEDVCEMMRKCCRLFFNDISKTAIMTSKRISVNVKQIHLKKRRKLMVAMENFDKE